MLINKWIILMIPTILCVKLDYISVMIYFCANLTR